MRRGRLASAAVFALTLSAGHAAASTPDEEAAKAYDEGAGAYDRGEFAVAARALARADGLAPSAVALELALHAALRADDAVLASRLADRARSRGAPSPALEALVRDVHTRFDARVGRLVVRCASGVTCTARVDGEVFEPGAEQAVASGTRHLEVRVARPDRGEAVQRLDVVVDPGRSVAVMATGGGDELGVVVDGRARDEDRARTPKPLAPVVFWVGVGVTAAVGAATIASGIDTQSRYDAFAADRSNLQAAEVGRSAEVRTNVLVAVTAGLAVVTAACGIFFVDWAQAPSKSAWSPAGVRF